MCTAYRLNTVSNATTKRWFQQLCSGDKAVEDETCSSRPIIKNINKITKIIELERHVRSPYHIAPEQKIGQKTVWNHLHKADLRRSSMYG
uniref:Uncharacterized protein n=1 Tax=Lepeophtheirus salmonis TaxID=72036 RepID=A0A0K2T1S9_LEPSM